MEVMFDAIFESFFISGRCTLYFGKVARMPDDNPLKQITFADDLQLAVSHFLRRPGRPRNEWTVMLLKHASLMTPDFRRIVHDVEEWKRAVRRYVTE